MVFNTIALVAQPVELPPLKRRAAGSNPAGCTVIESEEPMQRVISLFRVADYEQWSPSQQLWPPPREQDEPLYFSELLDFLRRQKALRRGVEQEDGSVAQLR